MDSESPQRCRVCQSFFVPWDADETTETRCPRCSEASTAIECDALDDLSRDELLALLFKLRLAGRRAQRGDSVQIWKAVSSLRSLESAIPMLKVALDYLDPPLEEREGKRGWSELCPMCGGGFFYSLDRSGGGPLCLACKDAECHMLHLGWDKSSCVVADSPQELSIYTKPGARAGVAKWLREMADFMEREG